MCKLPRARTHQPDDFDLAITLGTAAANPDGEAPISLLSFQLADRNRQRPRTEDVMKSRIVFPRASPAGETIRPARAFKPRRFSAPRGNPRGELTQFTPANGQFVPERFLMAESAVNSASLPERCHLIPGSRIMRGKFCNGCEGFPCSSSRARKLAVLFVVDPTASAAIALL